MEILKIGKILTEMTINPILLEEQADLSKCKACKDVIYSGMYRLWLMPYINNLRLICEKTEIKLCGSCKDLIKI